MNLLTGTAVLATSATSLAVTATGIALVAIVLVDVVATTVSVSGGAGPLSSRAMQAMWRVIAPVARRTSSRHVYVSAGPVILFSLLVMWLGGLLAGWSLVFAGATWRGSAGTSQPAAVDVLQYTASVIVGGRGSDVAPTGALVEVAEVVATCTGAITVSLLVAFILPVVSAVVDGRQLSAYVATLGHTPQRMLDQTWDGETFGDFDLHLIALAPEVVGQAEKHLAYPVLFYFHSLERHTSLPASLVMLDEAVTLVDCCIDARIRDSALVPVRVAVSEYLDTLRHGYITAGAHAPTRPDESSLRDQRVPLLEVDDLEHVYRDIADRRRLLAALVEHAGWRWDDITEGDVASMETERLALRDRQHEH